MRDCIFLVADKDIEATIQGFLGRPKFHLSLGCAPFQFDPRFDVKVAAGAHDPGLYVRGHELLRGFKRTHRRAVVVLDTAWEGSPGGPAIESHIRKNLVATGWEAGSVEVTAIEPEVESWIFIDSPLVAEVFGFQGTAEFRAWLEAAGLWAPGRAKPEDPKGAALAALEHSETRRSSALYSRVTERANVARCTDAAFIRLRETLLRWFPPAGGASGGEVEA